jgi:hypothetical protein
MMYYLTRRIPLYSTSNNVLLDPVRVRVLYFETKESDVTAY